jgi:2,5-diamino-6-(ribosylamino)-4(3H)-pyrimidinone 5'-phosphate reductase
MSKDILPKIILHNSISIDGSLTDFEPNMELHYKIASLYKPEAHIIGSNTIKKGIELFGEGISPEEKNDFERPERSVNLPYWVIIDTNGSLEGLLHTCRRFEFCRDVVILVSESTSKLYLKHLKERNYDYHIVGKNHVDLKKAIDLLSKKYRIKTILTDTGKILGNILLNKKLVSEISLLIHPIIVGKKSYNMFDGVTKDIKLTLIKNEILENQFIWLVYKVE